MELRGEGLFSQKGSNFIIYLEKADSWIDDIMKERIKQLLGEKHFEDFLYDMRGNLI